MAAHLHWRVNFSSTQTPGANPCDLGELILRDTPAGPQTAAGGVASASSIYGGGYAAANAFDGNPGSFWAANAPAPQWLQYDYPAPIAIVEIALTSSPANALGEAPAAGNLEYSDDGIAWTQAFGWTVVAFTANNQTRTAAPVIVPTTGIEASEGRAFSIFASIAAEERVAAGRVFSVYNFPSAGERVSAARVILPVKRNSAIDVSEARVFAIVRGRVADPKVRIWTCTLDGHDLVFLRLGDGATLVYDVYSEQWVDWDSKESGAWRPNTGMTWLGAVALADTYGSSIVAGDDTFGLLWFLDPEGAWDESPDSARGVQEIEFERIVTGQVLASGRAAIPCYSIFVDGDNYGLTATDFTPSITLEYSDDQGRNFDAAESLLVDPDITAQNPYSWYSLGQITSPGRIFRVVDNGVFTRIDSMSMNDDDDAG